jgi:hypothetical protein
MEVKCNVTAAPIKGGILKQRKTFFLGGEIEPQAVGLKLRKLLNLTLVSVGEHELRTLLINEIYEDRSSICPDDIFKMFPSRYPLMMYQRSVA